MRNDLDFAPLYRSSNGLLTVSLKREVPETMKPRKIEIGGALPQAAALLKIEAERLAA